MKTKLDQERRRNNCCRMVYRCSKERGVTGLSLRPEVLLETQSYIVRIFTIHGFRYVHRVKEGEGEAGAATTAKNSEGLQE